MTISPLSPESREEFLESLRVCVCLFPRQVATGPFSMEDFESAVRRVIAYHREISEDSDIPDDRAAVFEFAALLDEQPFIETLPHLLGIQGELRIDTLLQQVRALPDKNLCSHCVPEEVYQAYFTLRLRAMREERLSA